MRRDEQADADGTVSETFGGEPCNMLLGVGERVPSDRRPVERQNPPPHSELAQPPTHKSSNAQALSDPVVDARQLRRPFRERS